MDKKRYFALFGLIFAVVAVLGYFAYSSYRNSVALSKIYATVDSTSSYSQYVNTETILSDRLLEVEGTYFNNKKAREYASQATTTLTIPDQKEPISFTLSNIAIRDVVYTKIESESENNPITIPLGPTWHRFENDAIPEEFQSVSIPGPILDNLALFSRNGTYVKLVKNEGEDSTFGSPLQRYKLELSGETPSEESSVTKLIERIGEGTVTIWVDQETDHIHHIVFKNYPYVSTTTISNVNNPLPVLPPE